MSPYHCNDHEVSPNGKNHGNDQPCCKDHRLHQSPAGVHVIVTRWGHVGRVAMETGWREQIANRKWVTCLEFCFVIVVLVICEDRRRNGNPWTWRHYSLEGQGHTIYKGKDQMIKQITQKLQSCLCFLYYAVFVSSGRTIPWTWIWRVWDQKSYFRYQILILRYQHQQSVIGAYTDASAIRHPILFRKNINPCMQKQHVCMLIWTTINLRKLNHFLLHESQKKCLINGNNFGTGEHNIHKWPNCEENKL